jgi:hypothetical protein
MPPKIKELVCDLEMAGFVNKGGKGSIGTMNILTVAALLFLGNSQMMLNPIKFARPGKRLWSQNNERE